LRRLLFAAATLVLTACTKGPDAGFQLAQQGLLSADLSSDGSFAIIGSVHHGGSLWDAKRNERLFSWNHRPEGFSSFRTVALSGDATIAVTTEEKSIGVWSTESGKSLGFWQARDRVLAIDIDQKGQRALIGLRDGGLDYLDLRTGQVLQQLNHEADVRSVALSSDGSIGISGSDDFSAKTWDLSRGALIETLTLRNQIKQVAVSNDGELAFTSAQREGAFIWESRSGKTVTAIESRYTNYSSARFSEDGKQLLLGTSGGQIEVRDVQSGAQQSLWQAKPRKSFGGASSKAILSVSEAGKVFALTADGMIEQFSR